MEITEVLTGLKKSVVIRAAEEIDFKVLIKKRYSFNWKLLKNKSSLYKLQPVNEDDILGVMALNDYPDESRIEIKLLASSRENIGRKKVYEGIAGCMIAFACSESLKEYAELACVSLVPKTELKRYYIEKYKMEDAGVQVFMDGKVLHDMIKQYIL